MELYYCRKRLVLPTIEDYLSQGLNCSKISYESILYEIDLTESIYLVNSKTERDVKKYLVNMELGI